MCAGEQNASSGDFVLGTDGPPDEETIGFNINHLCLVVNDLDASVHFYGKILGMRHIFTYRASETYTIVYMGYSRGGEDGKGFQTGEELNKAKMYVLSLQNSIARGLGRKTDIFAGIHRG